MPETTWPGRNIELKARIHSLHAARAVAERIATGRLGVERQVDTYFCCNQGRLKLRRREGRPAQLVAYRRADQAGPKASDYRLVEVQDAEGLEQALGAALGAWAVVEKRREIFLHHNVRIHLDQVAGLGDFLEFEAMLDPCVDDQAGQAQLQLLAEQFGISPRDLVDCSYSA